MPIALFGKVEQHNYYGTVYIVPDDATAARIAAANENQTRTEITNYPVTNIDPLSEQPADAILENSNDN